MPTDYDPGLPVKRAKLERQHAHMHCLLTIIVGLAFAIGVIVMLEFLVSSQGSALANILPGAEPESGADLNAALRLP
jgi:hypothetical protein